MCEDYEEMKSCVPDTHLPNTSRGTDCRSAPSPSSPPVLFAPRWRCFPSRLSAPHLFDALWQSFETKQSLRRETCLLKLWGPIRIHKSREPLVNGGRVVFHMECALSHLPLSPSLLFALITTYNHTVHSMPLRKGVPTMHFWWGTNWEAAWSLKMLHFAITISFQVCIIWTVRFLIA